MSFPVTPRYFINFRNSDTGLTPTFVFFKNASSFANITAPSITELSNGEYYFDYTYTTKTDPDVVFEIDGGASIPTEEVRYVKGTLSPRDRFLDEPVSQVVSDVWADSNTYTSGQKGLKVDTIGTPSDTSASPTLFGKALLYKESVRGDSAGSSDGDSVKQVFDRIGAPVGASISADIAAISGSSPSAATIASAVWNEALAGHTTAGTSGKKLTDGAITTDVTSSTASIKGIGNIDNTQINTKLGAPAGADMSTDIASIKSDTTAINSNTASLGNQLTRALGLMHENSVLDQTVFDGANNLTNGRLRTYDSKSNALGAGVTGLLHTYTITATYVGQNVQTYSVVLEP